MQDTICNAISNQNIFKVIYDGNERVVEPYLLYKSAKGKHILHGWQIDGEWEKTPPPDWCNMSLSKISSVTVLDKTYDSPHPDYKPHSSRFYSVICYA